MKALTHFICFNCASIFSIVEDSEVTCKDCGYIIKTEYYNNIMNYAFEAAYYGHLYRQAYEKQLTEKGEIKTRHCLNDPSTILCFLAVAALSGVVGNLSTELVKRVFRAILKKVKSYKKDIGQNEVSFLNDSYIDIYIQQINIFHNDFKGIKPSVKAEIIKEMFIHELGDSFLPEENTGVEVTREAILEAFKLALDKVENRQKLSKQDFENFWKAIDDKNT